MFDIKTLRGTLDDRVTKLRDKLEGYKNDDGSMRPIPAEVREELQKEQREVDDLGIAYSTARTILGAEERMAERGVATNDLDTPKGVAADGRTVGEVVVNGPEYTQTLSRRAFKNLGGGGISVDVPGVSFKTTMTTAAGFSAPNNRTSIVVPYPTRRVLFQQYIPQINTDVSTVKYMLESTFTNNAAGAAENAVLGENAIAFTETSATIELIGAFLPVTEQQLEDVPGIQGIINERLLHMYDLKEEADLISGNGSTPNIRGVYSATNVQTQAKGTDDTPSAIYKAMTLVRHTGFAEPTLCLLHPNDWQDIKLLKDGNGNFIWGSPAEAGPETIWGLPTLITTAATENTGLVGDFAMYAALWRNRGATVTIGYVADDFKYNRLTVKVTGRMAPTWYRGQAFCKITGI